jgi:hypothetical protein
VLAQEPWEIVRLPAIAEDNETIVVDSLLGPRCSAYGIIPEEPLTASVGIGDHT